MIDFDNNIIVGCIPVNSHPTHPPDQKGCIIEPCEICTVDIWVSKLKRKYRKNKKNVQIYCFMCIQQSILEQDIDLYNLELVDINSIKIK